MSKRFGRNQRRRAREEVASWKEQSRLKAGYLLTAHRQADELRAEMRQLEQRLDDAKAVLGKDHPVFAAGGYQHHRNPPALTFQHRLPTGQVANMVAFELEARPDDVKAQIHMHLYAGRERVGYAISQHALRNIPEHVLVRRITEEIIFMALAEIRRAKA